MNLTHIVYSLNHIELANLIYTHYESGEKRQEKGEGYLSTKNYSQKIEVLNCKFIHRIIYQSEKLYFCVCDKICIQHMKSPDKHFISNKNKVKLNLMMSTSVRLKHHDIKSTEVVRNEADKRQIVIGL